MRIEAISSPRPYIAQQHAQTFKAKMTNIAQYKEQKERYTKPEYYQSMALAKYNKVALQVESDKDTNVRVNLDEDITKRYLTSKNGLVNPDLVQKFIKYFSLNLDNEKQFSSDGEEILYNAANKTVDFFRLSKNEDGYDFSDYENKMKVIDVIDSSQTNNIIADDDDDFYNQIRKNSRNDDGNLDYEAIYSMLALVPGSSFGLPPEKAIKLIKRLYRFDNNQKFVILNALVRLNETYFHISNENNSTQQLMELCFDSNHDFKKERAQKMFEAVDIAESWLLEKMETMECDNEEDEENLFQTQLNIATQSVLDCFREYNRTPDLDFEEYINKYLNKFAFFPRF